ncbi:hypothetical protein NPIL_105081 [Nephila pilipes]|uniref:Uncharacterized protein n=1 Tax=Nephila pilipes TaxID=299642 RepID=A0A8X6N583_NEPPI|nr:hypothetical protein NPIL_105081 [Nephila pilipes]
MGKEQSPREQGEEIDSLSLCGKDRGNYFLPPPEVIPLSWSGETHFCRCGKRNENGILQIVRRDSLFLLLSLAEKLLLARQ